MCVIHSVGCVHVGGRAAYSGGSRYMSLLDECQVPRHSHRHKLKRVQPLFKH